MPLNNSFFAMALLCASFASAQVPAIGTDPAPDKSAPAAMVQLAVPSHGEQLLGVFYLASGAGTHPTAIVMHGFPGYEQNLDLAQAIRRAGWNVMAVHYRGSWGVKGTFSYTHAIEDADAEVAFLHDPATAAKYHIDTNKIVLIGHSMGGFMVASAGAHDPKVAGVVMISAWNIGGIFSALPASAEQTAVTKFVQNQTKNDLTPLAGTSAETLGREVFTNRATMVFSTFTQSLAARPVLIITSNDGLAPDNDKFAASLQQAGDKHVQTLHYATDHSYSDHRIQLASAILNFLATIQ
jgi:pimeloyl-ACP methyl ester carboxylesterase